MNNTEIMSAKEVATYLNISYWTLTEMVRRKEIPHFRIGKRILFRTDSLLEWVCNQEKKVCEEHD